VETIDLFEEIMGLYEEGRLKTQKISKKYLATGTPDIAVSKFKNLVKLTEECTNPSPGSRQWIASMVTESETQ
jgi:hypothetical protein